MPIHTSFIEDQGRLELTFHGNLDFGITRDIFAIRRNLPVNLKRCVMDLSGVDRVFDSGVALLQVLCTRFNDLGVEIDISAGTPEITMRIPVAA